MVVGETAEVATAVVSSARRVGERVAPVIAACAAAARGAQVMAWCVLAAAVVMRLAPRRRRTQRQVLGADTVLDHLHGKNWGMG